MIMALFWFIDIETSNENFFYMMAYGLMANWIFVCQGYCLGIFFPDGSTVNTVNVIFIILMLMTNGVVSNLTDANPILVVLQFITPSRFLTEGFFRRMVGNIPDLDAATGGAMPIN